MAMDAYRLHPPPPWSRDDLSWHLDQKHFPESSRCSLLIQEVSLLVGLTPDDDPLSSDDDCPLLPDPHPHDILPLNLTPTKSLAPRDLWNGNTPSLVSQHTGPHAHTHARSPVAPRDPATPIPRHKRVDASPSPQRRHGQVFHVDPLPSNPARRNAVDLDDMFSSPRMPPPKPAPNPSTARCSSLDRLECSLLKLEAYAPTNHRKSGSEGRSLDRVAQGHPTRPSLPPAPRLKQPQSSPEITCRSPSRPPRPRRFSGPLPPLPEPPHQSIAPPSCPAAPLDQDSVEDRTPGSFMEMDIPLTGQARPKRQASFRSKEKVKSLASVARRVSRGVVAWGKNLTGSTKPGAAKQTTARPL